MMEWFDVVPWVLPAVGPLLAVIGILLAHLREKRAKERASRIDEKATRVEEKLDSLQRVIAFEGKVIDKGNGIAAEVVMHPNGVIGLNYTLVAEPAVFRVKGFPVTMRSTRGGPKVRASKGRKTG